MATKVLDDIVGAVQLTQSAIRSLERRPVAGMAQSACWHLQCAKHLMSHVESEVTTGRASAVPQKDR